VLSFRNVSAAAFFLFGTTFVWMTASFVGQTPPPKGILWTVVDLIALLAVAMFSAAAWGVFHQTSWWESVAVVSAIVGLLAIVPLTIAIQAEGELGDQGVVMNIMIHATGSLVVLATALLPAVHDRFAHRWA
jgi:hypothetical protein